MSPTTRTGYLYLSSMCKCISLDLPDPGKLQQIWDTYKGGLCMFFIFCFVVFSFLVIMFSSYVFFVHDNLLFGLLIMVIYLFLLLSGITGDIPDIFPFI